MNNDTQKLKDEIEKLKKVITTLQFQLKTVNAKVGHSNEQIRRLQGDLARIKK